MVQILAAILFMGSFIVAMGVVIAMIVDNADAIAAALNREAMPLREISIRTRSVRLLAPRLVFSAPPTLGQLRRAAA